MQRVRNVAYDDDDLYEDDDYAEEDVGAGAGAGEAGEEAYTQEDRDNFANLTPVVCAELDEAGVPSTTAQIEEALWHYYWDVGKSVAYLKNARTPRQPQPQKQQQAKKEKPKSKFDEAAALSAQKAAETAKATESVNGLAKKTEALNVEPSPSAPATSKVKSKGLDVAKLWAEEKSQRKSSAAFVVIGHVDHGKSTLMGRLLLDTGAVSQRNVDKFKKQAAEMGKASFALAWIMDTGAEERERGVTVDIAQHHFSTEAADFTILDAPGHRDFVPNMISGASMADLAVLVVDANQLESGMKGQTREHILLAHAVGLRRIIVAVNKMDSTSPAWDRETFDRASGAVQRLLLDTGFREDDITVLPCSGLGGENVVRPPSSTSPGAWVAQAYPTLLHQLEHRTPPEPSAETVRRPFRMQIADVFRGGLTSPLSIAGRISSGAVQVGDALRIQPGGAVAAVKGIDVAGTSREWAVASELPSLHLVDIDPQLLRTGDVACSAAPPSLPVVRGVEARVCALAALLPQPVAVHVGRLHVAGRIVKLIATLDQKGDTLRANPRVVREGQIAQIRIEFEEDVAMEEEAGVVLRLGEGTVAEGKVVNR